MSLAPVRIEFAPGQKIVQVQGRLSGVHDEAEFSFLGRADQRVKIDLSAPGGIRGQLVFPSGKVEGAPGGRIFDGRLPETGEYHVRVHESPMGESWVGAFVLGIERRE